MSITCTRVTLLAAVGVLVLTSSPAAGQLAQRTSPGDWWLGAGYGVADVGGGYGSVLEGGPRVDLTIAKGSGAWRFGSGLQFAGLDMKAPFGSQLEWARLEVFGSVRRVFSSQGAVRPYLEVRPGLVRVHSRSRLFHTISKDDFEEGLNPTPASDGIGLTVRPGIEIDLRESVALELSASLSSYWTGDYDLSPIEMTRTNRGSEWGIVAGLAWRPLGRGVPSVPTGPATSPLRAAGAHGDGWGVPQSWGWATAEMLGINFGASMLNEYTRGESSYPISPQSWWFNVERGWKFDDNKFATNQLIHPFNGGTYFNSARANGIGFWGSSAMTLVGAFLWECCGETQPMSWNDMLSTGLGGISEGEVAYRTSSLILDNTARGRERAWREVAAFAVNPVRSFNRVLSGRAGRIQGNPSDPFDRRPPRVLAQLDVGARTIGLGKSITDNTNRYGFLDFVLIFGDPFENTRRRPFDRFDAYIQFDVGDKTGIGRLQVRGDLWSTPIGGPAGTETRHAFAIVHDFDYINNEAYEVGGQGLGVAWFSRFGAFERRFIQRLSLTGIVGAAVNAEYAFLADIPDPRAVRDYDYGTGLGIGYEALLLESARTKARIDYRYTFMGVHNGSISEPASGIFDIFGSDARHQVHRAGLEVLVAISDHFAVGFESSVFFRDSEYDDPALLDRSQRNPELRVYVSRGWR